MSDLRSSRRARELRTLLIQAAIAAVMAAGLLWLFTTTHHNLERLGVQSGFRFLTQRAGFAIPQTLISYSEDSTILRAFVVALLNTAVLVGASIPLASVLGLTVGIARVSPNVLVARLGTVYVETFRNIPLLLQIFFWYYVVLRSLPDFADSIVLGGWVVLNNRGLYLPAVTCSPAVIWLALTWLVALTIVLVLRHRGARSGLSPGHQRTATWAFLGLTAAICLAGVVFSDHMFSLSVPHAGRFGYSSGFYVMPEFLAMWAGLSIYQASYIAEIVRSGLLSVPPGQAEAARALGLKFPQIVRLITIPLALRVIVPPLATVYMNIFKSSSLGAAIAYPEIVSVFVGTINNIVGQPLEIMAVTLVFYVCVSLLISFLLNRYNSRVQLRK